MTGLQERGAGRAAMVAGAGGGIGRACVEHLTASGWRVFGVDRSVDHGLDDHLRDGDDTSGEADGASKVTLDEADVTLPGMADRVVEDAEQRLGALNGVVHAVGMSGRRLGDGPVSVCTHEAWDEVMRVNLGSAFRLVRAGLPALRRAGGGSIVLIGSVLAESTDLDFLTAAYAASKGGMVSLARTAAREGARYDVRVNVVAAGLVHTPMAQRAAADPHIQSRLEDLQPLGGGMLEPTDVAGAVAWLLSDSARRVTGTVVPVDAGWLL